MEPGAAKRGAECSVPERKKKVRRRSTGPDSVSEIIKKWKEQNQKLQEENGSRKAPAKGSKKGCMAGKGGPENSNCKYRGVRQRTWGKWVAEIREPNRGNRLWLGSFPNAVEAAHAYDEAARAMYGATARVNFSEHSPDGNSGYTSAPPVLMSNGPTAPSHPSDERDESESPPSRISDEPTAALQRSDAKDEPESVGTVVHEVKKEVSTDSKSICEERKTAEVFQPEGKALHKEVKVQPYKRIDSCPRNRVAKIINPLAYMVLYLSLQHCYSQLSCCCFFDIGLAFGIHVDSVSLPFCRQSCLSSPFRTALDHAWRW